MPDDLESVGTEPSNDVVRRRRVAAWVVFFVVLAIGMAIAITNTPTHPDTGDLDRSGWAIPLLTAGGMAWAVRRGGGKGVLIGILVILLTGGLTCAVIISNLDFS